MVNFAEKEKFTDVVQGGKLFSYERLISSEDIIYGNENILSIKYLKFLKRVEHFSL